MLKKSVFVLFVLILILGLAGSASATKPEPVYCVMFWLNGNWEQIFFEVEGEMAYNQTAQVWNISCHYKFDFTSGEWLDLATICSLVPYACNKSQTSFTWFGWPWASEDGYTEDTTFRVGKNGEATYFAQLAPNQCGNMWMGPNYTYVPLEVWTPGSHTYQYIEVFSDGEYPGDPIAFEVQESAPILDSSIRMGPYNLRSSEGLLEEPYIINPNQETFFQVTYIYYLKGDADWLHDNMTLKLIIDNGEPIFLNPGPVTNNCAAYNDGTFQRNWGIVR